MVAVGEGRCTISSTAHKQLSTHTHPHSNWLFPLNLNWFLSPGKQCSTSVVGGQLRKCSSHKQMDLKFRWRCSCCLDKSSFCIHKVTVQLILTLLLQIALNSAVTKCNYSLVCVVENWCSRKKESIMGHCATYTWLAWSLMHWMLEEECVSVRNVRLDPHQNTKHQAAEDTVTAGEDAGTGIGFNNNRNETP